MILPTMAFIASTSLQELPEPTLSHPTLRVAYWVSPEGKLDPKPVPLRGFCPGNDVWYDEARKEIRLCIGWQEVGLGGEYSVILGRAERIEVKE